MQFEDLIASAWDEWDLARADHAAFVPEASAPILWFGDLDVYRKSAIKIVTVGVNPGPKAFPEEDPWRCYPRLAGGSRDSRIYSQAMNEYPFYEWFGAWNPVLRPLDAAHPVPSALDAQNRPLHVDLSPLMTCPVMSEVAKADSQAERAIIRSGVEILRRLIHVLEPDFTFVSVKKGHFDVLARVARATPTVHGTLDGHVIGRYQWDLPGEVVWFRRTNVSSITCGLEARRAVGRWMAGGPSPTWGAAAPRLTTAELVEVLRDALAAPNSGDWRRYGGKLGFSHKINIVAPGGGAAHLSSQARPSKIREFIDLWDATPAARTGWTRVARKSFDHVGFPPTGRHIPGLYLRWDEQRDG